MRRGLIVAGSRHLVHPLSGPKSPLKGDYEIIRDAVRKWERENGSFDYIISGTQGHVLRNGSKIYALPEPLEHSDVIHGADLIGEYFARVYDIPVERYPADWARGGKYTSDPSAGPERNQRMVDVAVGLVVVFMPDSTGSHDVLRRSACKRIPIVDECLPQRRKW